MEREKKQIDRREIERRRDAKVKSLHHLRKARKECYDVLNRSAAVLPIEDFASFKHESRWILQAVDNRIAGLDEQVKRYEGLMLMLDEQAKEQKQREEIGSLYIGGKLANV